MGRHRSAKDESVTSPLMGDQDHDSGDRDSVGSSTTSTSGISTVNIPTRKLGIFGVVALAFFNVSGGPYGSEEIVKSGGPFWSLLVLLLMPWFWSFPVALMTAELSSLFDSDGGYTIWVQQAFGNFMAWNEGYWSWLGGVTDNALYPALVIEYCIQAFVGTAFDDFNPYEMFALKLLMCLVLTAMALRGIDVVGWSLSACNILVLLPFVFIFFMAIYQADPSQWLVRKPAEEVKWVSFINVMVWNINGWDACSTFAGEVKNPGKTYPRAMVIAVIVVILCNILPLLAATGVAHDFHEYKEGYYVKIAEKVGGKWLAIGLLLGSSLSNACQFLAEMTQDAYQLCGMAETGIVPKFFSKRSRWETPWVAILASFIVILVLITRDFGVILQLDNTMYCLALLLECFAFVKLRWTHSKLDRPYKVPVPGVIGAMAFVFCPICVCLAVLWFTALEVKIASLVAILLGFIGYFVNEGLRSKKCLQFYPKMGQLNSDSMKAALAQDACAELTSTEKDDDDDMGATYSRMAEEGRAKAG